VSRKEREGRPEPRRIRLPGFIVDDSIGLGDVIHRATSYLGIKPCGRCEQRRESLKRRVIFAGPRKR
jgi:hypothetical protein